MSKSQERQRCFDFGRVFFQNKTNFILAPDVIYFQPLGNHVGNVRKLVKAWKLDDFPGNTEAEREESKARVDEAARIHDIGKPPKFKLEAKTTKEGKFKEYIYSFKEHRFLADSADIWAKYLAIGHHDFSVADISRDAYKLKKESQKYEEILTKEPLAYARELYILEMCDQIEAELACRVIENDEQAESRAFMEYTTTKLDNSTYLIDPYPFSNESIPLSFAYWSMELSQEDKKELENLVDKPHKMEEKINNIVKEWWQSHQGKAEKEQPKLVVIQSRSLVDKDSYKDWNCETAYKELSKGKYLPNPMQKDVWDAISNPNPAFLLKAPTGSGKMEAVVFPCLTKGYRLILPLPSRSLIEDQKLRIENYIKTFSALPKNQNREFSLVVDTGSQMERLIYQNGNQVNRKINSRRHLYKGDLILTTMDKFLYRYFGYGDKQKSFVFPLRINQEKTLICFDEAHSYDDISFTNFYSLVQSLYEAGRSLVLMTATMPDKLIKRFDYLERIDYGDSVSQTRRKFQWLKDIHRDSNNLDEFHSKFSDVILSQCQKRNKARIIAVIESVKDAVEIYKKLKNKLGVADDNGEKYIFLYHGRIADQLRTELYQQIQKRDADNQPYILVTTSAIEVGCDLNSEVLISQICPPENLIQRAGRCNRKKNVADAEVILVGDEIPNYVNTLDESEWENYQNTLQSLKNFDPVLMSECISKSEQIDDYRVVELFSMLHEYVYQADLTCQPTHKRGLIPTRSWTPSVNLVDIATGHSISVPIDRFCNHQEFADVYAYEKWYDKENTRWDDEHLLGWGSAYAKEITVRISPGGVNFDLPKYDYDKELGFVEIPKVFTKKWTDGAEVKLLYVQEKHKAIVTYIESFDEKINKRDDDTPKENKP